MTQREIDAITDILRLIMARQPDDDKRMEVANMFVELAARAYAESAANNTPLN